MKITYKTYFNERLKKVDFHGKLTHPLYVQVTYDRKSIFFKSYFFDLLSKPRFLLDIPGAGKKGPEAELAIRKEQAVIDFVIEKNKDDFSLDIFKSQYDYYCQDVCDLSEVNFREYLFRFFWDEGLPTLGDLVKHGGRYIRSYELVEDCRRTFQRERYDKLIRNSFSYAPAYLPLFGFMLEHKRWPEYFLTMMEFYDEETMKAFMLFMDRTYPDVSIKEMMEYVIQLPFLYNKYRNPPLPKDLDPWK